MYTKVLLGVILLMMHLHSMAQGGIESARLYGAFSCSKQWYHPIAGSAISATIPATAKWKVAVLSERKYSVSGLYVFGCGVTMPAGKGGLGLNFSASGTAGYNRLEANLGWGRRLTDLLSIGLGLRAGQASVSGYRSQINLIPMGSAALALSDAVQIAIQTSFPYGFESGTEKGHSSGSFDFVMGWEISEQCFTGVHVQRHSGLTAVMTTFLYQPVSSLFIRTGINATTHSPALGLGYRLGGLVLEVAAARHPSLGYSPSLILSYLPK